MVREKVTIIRVVKRPWWQRMLSIKHWRVTVEEKDGIQHTFNAWADIFNPNIGSLRYSIRQYFRGLPRGQLPEKAKGETVDVW